MNGNKIISSDKKDDYADEIKNNIKTSYCAAPNLNSSRLEELYLVDITDGSGNITHGAPWYGNEEEIKKRVGCDLNGNDYEYNKQKYKGKNLINTLSGKTIIEVTNEIDNSKYLMDGDTPTDLLQQYEMPTIEVVYIIK